MLKSRNEPRRLEILTFPLMDWTTRPLSPPPRNQLLELLGTNSSGSGQSTASGANNVRSWVRILPVTGLFSSSYSFLSHLTINRSHKEIHLYVLCCEKIVFLVVLLGLKKAKLKVFQLERFCVRFH